MAKLLNMVAPGRRLLRPEGRPAGAVVRRLVRDLDMPVRIEVCPTVREPDGLALSSRNALPRRRRARARHSRCRARCAPCRRVAAGERDAGGGARRRARGAGRRGVEPEYLGVVPADTLEPVGDVDGEVLVAVAARVGAVRLIDNDADRPS